MIEADTITYSAVTWTILDDLLCLVNFVCSIFSVALAEQDFSPQILE